MTENNKEQIPTFKEDLVAYHSLIEMEVSQEKDPAFREYLIGRLEHNRWILNLMTSMPRLTVEE